MGTSRGIDVCLNLFDIIQRVDCLHDITKPFTTEEIDGVIAKMSCDKAPGPDGFNCMFLKKCWPIIKHGFYQLAEDIYLDKVALDSINNSYITLVPKCQIPEKINDYMPISLTNCCLMFLTKMAAGRLQEVIMDCIHKNQYGFINKRTIHDCVAWAFEYIYQCKASGASRVILKLDFEKAFDTIEHEALFQILRHTMGSGSGGSRPFSALVLLLC
jgi:hypothetical protein